MSHPSFSGKLALVIGGSEGIGYSLAVSLVQQGSHVVIGARREEPLRNALASFEFKRSNTSQRLGFVEVDVTDYEALRRVIDDLVQKYGNPDLVINCAGFARPGYLCDLPLEEVRGMMEVNFFGALHVSKAIEPHFKNRGSGYLVHFSSIAGFLGLFGYTGYCASKFAVIGFCEALRRELAPFGIRVSVVCPPNTRTPGLVRENEFKPAEVLKTEEKVKAVDPDEIAGIILKKIARNQFLIHPTLDGALSYYLNRYAPWVIERFAKRPESGRFFR